MIGYSRGLIILFVFFITLILGGNAMALELKCSAFSDGGNLPSKYTCDGNGDYSPPLSWTGAPAGTKSFALISDDPDAPAGTWVHWLMWNIPATTSTLKENFDKSPTLPDGTRQGINDGRRSGYGAPCPPSGTHRYYFKLYALDTTLDLPPTTTKTSLQSAMQGHILEQSQIMGKYSRQK